MPRPKVDISGDAVRKLAEIGCTNAEIADALGCSTDTIERRFLKELHGGRAVLKQSLRRMQLDACRAGSVTMMIWLGKQLLGQKDHPAPIDPSAEPESVKVVEIEASDDPRAYGDDFPGSIAPN